MPVICVEVSFSKRSLGVWSALVNLRSVLTSLRIYGELLSDKNNCKQRKERMRCYRKRKRERERANRGKSSDFFQSFFFFSRFIFSIGISNNFSIKPKQLAPGSSRMNHNITNLLERKTFLESKKIQKYIH